MNYFPFHIGDYASATRHLSWEEDAAYRRLLDVYYTTEKPLSLDHKQVCRLVLATTEAQREAVQTVLEEFFVRTEAGWVNTRADAEINAMRDKQQKQRDKANKRWHKPEAEPGIATAMPQHTKTDATALKIDADAMPPTPTPTPTPTPLKEEKRIARGSRLPVDFSPDFGFAFDLGIQNTLEEASKFRDYWRAQPGQKGVKTDWSATWRNWCRNAKPSARASPLTFRERDAANAAARIHEMTGGLVSAKPVSITRRNDALQEVFDAIPAAKRLG